MAFQSTVFNVQGFGVVGDFFNDGPRRVQSYIINSADATNNVFGRAFTITSEGVAQAGSGGTMGFAGILISPKEVALQGTAAGGTLAPSLIIPNYTQGECATMGTIVVTLPAAAAIGDLVVYDDTTGVLETIAPDAALPVGKTYANAFVDYFTVTAAGLAVITLSPQYHNPVPA